MINIKNWFVRDIPDGQVRPVFFLYTNFNSNRKMWTYWIMPIAPVIILWNALCTALRVFWGDLIVVEKEWRLRYLEEGRDRDNALSESQFGIDWGFKKKDDEVV